MHWKAGSARKCFGEYMSNWLKDAEIHRDGTDAFFWSVVKSRRVKLLDGSDAHFSKVSV
jgi:hypothetical protein